MQKRKDVNNLDRDWKGEDLSDAKYRKQEKQMDKG